MASVDLAKLRAAIRKRKDHVLKNLDTLTMKQFRALLEKDLHLPDKSLREHKEAIEEMVDQMVTSSKDEDAKEGKGKASSSSKQQEKANIKPKKADKPHKGPAAIKKQRTSTNDAKPAAASKQQSKAVEKMKKVCKQAGIKIPPNIYKAKTGQALEEAFDTLLDKHDLTQHSTASDITTAAKRLQKEKDLEGIDTSNIVEGGRRSRARVDYSAVLKSQVGSDSEGEEEEPEDQDSAQSSSSGSGADSDMENVSPVSRPGKRKQHQRKAAASEGSQEAEDEEEEEEGSENASGAEQDSDVSEQGDSPPKNKAKKTSSSDAKAAVVSTGKGKKAKVKSAPSASPAPKVKAEPVASPKSVPEQLPSSKAKNRQPLQEHNAELAVKAEPGSIHKSPGHSGLQRRTLAAWSDDED